MRICFVCGSQRTCEHREYSLLPPWAKRIAARKISAEYTALSTRETEGMSPEVMQRLYDTAANLEREWRTVKKPQGKAVDSGAKKTRFRDSHKTG